MPKRASLTVPLLWQSFAPDLGGWGMKRLLLTLAAAATTLPNGFAQAQVAAPPVVAVAPPASMLHVPEGTEVTIRFEDTVTSLTAKAGDQFNISLDDEIALPSGVTIPVGYRGIGEVMSAERHGFIGKAGQLNVQVDYIKIGTKRLRIRANKSGEGKGSLGAAVALTVLFGPLGLLARGADITIPAGQKLKAFVDSDTDIPMPLAAPPA